MTKRAGLILCVITIVVAGLACGYACTCGEKGVTPAEFELSNLAISPTEVKIGETERHFVKHVQIYQWNAEVGDLIRVSDWLPLVK